MDDLKTGTLVADERARIHFQQAINIDPTYSFAYSGMSLSYFNEWSCQIWERWDISHQGAYDWAQKAIDLDPHNAVAAMVLGRVYIYEAKYDIGEHYLRKALQLNANDVETLTQIAVCLLYLDKIDEAYNLYQRAVQLNHLSEEQHFYIGAFIALERRDFAGCIRLSSQGQLPWVDSYAFLAAAYYETGDMTNMKATWDRFMAEFKRKILKGQRQAVDREAVQWVINVNPYRGKSQQRRFWEYMGGKQATSSPRVFYEATPPAPNFFFREHDGWQMSFDGKVLRLRHAKGLSDIAELLAKPNDQIHCTQLMGSGLEVKSQTIVDEKSMREFKKRLTGLQEEIALLELQNNPGGLTSLYEEYDQLLDVIKAATGLGGRRRNMESPLDKIRSAVTWRIRSAIKKISDGHPAFGKHLDNSVKTGLFCSYSPEKPVSWAVER
jgi:tetratricopeptide (TPR) repeat protein